MPDQAAKNPTTADDQWDFFNPIKRLEFENGWTVDVHRGIDGETWYRRWAPGVASQGWFDELYRQPSDWFNEQVAKVPHKEKASRADRVQGNQHDR